MGISINSRILLSAASIALAAALVVGATFAFFSDSETSTGNTFTAGTLDLKVDSTCHYFQDNVDVGCGEGDAFGNWAQTDLESGVHTFFNFDDIKPGDRGENTVSLHVIDNDAWGRFVISNVVDTDNENDGGLQSALLFNIWLDQGSVDGFQCGDTPACESDSEEGDNIQQENNEPTLVTAGNVDLGGETHNIWEGLAAAHAFNGGGDSAGILADGRMVGSTTYYFGIAWELPAETGNEVQGDSLSATLAFEVVQHRNNPGQAF